MTLINRLVCILTVLGLLFLTGYAVLLARADSYFRRNTIPALRQAVSLVPGNAEYHELLAEQLEAAGIRPEDELEAATKTSPFDSRYWIRRGVRAEVEQNFEEAERDLLEAHQVSQGFDPRSALMNFYFRRGQYPQFWKFAGEALRVSYDSPDPIFRLTLAANSDAGATWRMLPPRHEIRVEFLNYLSQNGLAEAAAPFAEQLAEEASSDEVPAFLNYCTRQLGHNDESALRVWNSLCSRRLLPFAELQPSRGQVITDGEFTATPLSAGFHWSYASGNGTKIEPMNTGQGLSIEIDGREPDDVDLVQEIIPIDPGLRYRISYEYRLEGDQTDTGLQWIVRADESKVPVAVSPIFTSRQPATETLEFTAPEHRLAKLVLVYHRAPGTLHWKGAVEISHISSALGGAVR